MSNSLVSYSRAGDVFHYRWAARRCLRLIYPNSHIRNIYIEGSIEPEKAGEYVIDVSEYSTNDHGAKIIDYFQLKHTTVKYDEPFTISDLKDTFKGFAARYLQHKKENFSEISNISFIIITNRKVADSFKINLSAIIKNKKVDNVFQKTIESYTSLTSEDLVSFCALVHFEDSEGNYNIQKQELRQELAQLIAGSIDNAQIENLIALVQEKVLPDSIGYINREEVLKRFGISSEKGLYPAPPKWEEPENIIKRQQYNDLLKHIINSKNPVIIHAAGGVGKSIFCLQLINSLPEGSLGIAYDCFGAGSYRNRSESRHKHRDALVQIVNEIASKGLCDPLLVQNTTIDEDIMQKFLLQIDTTIKSLRKTTDSAQLFILIDAADNAEMAAKEYSQSCFAHELLREKMPDGCKLVLLCRTERIQLLQPQSFILQLELEPFSEEETLDNLRKWYPLANENDGIEFHRLTAGNPRGQANALNMKYGSLNELLASLGPLGISVEKQIELQLNIAISKIKDLLPLEHHNQINSICLSLASLPPHIPLEVLSKVADVSIEHIKSFVSDIGRSIWIYDSSLQFRDEPTETWFRNTFLATQKNYEEYITILEPVAHQISYVAEVLPQLYLQAGKYNRLINIALSDDYLPENNPIEIRNIRVYRLQFAFKAALKLKNFKDAIKLALRAGEEVAGNQRQLSLFQSNIDLLTLLQSKEKVQEIAFKRLLRSNWVGSENIFSSSLLSGINEYHGEARGYLRASMNWLNIWFEEQKKNEDDYHTDAIQDNDILELAYTHLNIYGVESCTNFLLGLIPKDIIFRIVMNLTRRLLDVGRFEEIKGFLCYFVREPYYLVAATSELIQVGKFPEADEIETCLDLLCSRKSRIEKPNDFFNDRITAAIISFLDVCIYRNLSPHKILRVLRYYVPIKANRMVYSSHSSSERTVFIKALAIRAVLSGESRIDMAAISPSEFETEKKNYEQNNEVKDFNEIIFGLFPWYLLRAQVLKNKDVKLLDIINTTNESSQKARTNRYRTYDSLPNEITQVCASIMVLYNQATQDEICEFYKLFLQDNKAFTIQDKLNTLHAIYRSPHLKCISQQFELSIYKLIKGYNSDGPEEIANRYISLARAVIVNDKKDASVYFDEAINIASKFGDELVQRWEAIVSLSRRACDRNTVSNELAYRFIRCAEFVGENVSREKYWDRSEAIRVCARMSPGIGISALSRWRDRDIGTFEYQLEAILIELVSSRVITASVAWPLTRFFSNHQLNKFISICLENEPSINIQESLLEDAIHLLQLDGISIDYWEDLKKIANNFNVNNEVLDTIINSYAKNQTLKTTKKSVFSSSTLNVLDPDPKWDDIFIGLNISTHEGFASLIERFEAKEKKDGLQSHIRSLLKEVIARIEERSILSFLDVVFLSDNIDRYEVQEILFSLPEIWRNKVSYQVKLPDIVYKFGERYAHELANKYYFNSFVKGINLDKVLIEKFVSGILAGLSNGDELADADMFFGFVSLVSDSIEYQDAISLVDYSLSRFELHVEEDFGDGGWNKGLHITDDINKNIAGFIWAALGSPRSEVRWNAAHCVKKVAEFKCTNLLDALVYWLKHDEVDAFGHHKFPFYSLHARQYLLIAFARISLENPELLHKYSSFFIDFALFQSHVLIQKFAVDVVLNIENFLPGTYGADILTSIKNVGRSNLPTLEREYEYSTESYWHKERKIKSGNDFHFGWDFDRYWYEPLGDVFGVPSEQIQELAASLIINEWSLKDKNGYNNDPRVILWNRSSNERETWHNHGGYPRVDNFDFYLSYHSMLVIAARLIEKMPIIKKRELLDDPWSDWLSRHLLTRQDGKWLADCRDPLPLIRPKWISEENKKSWQTDITEDDFLNCLEADENGELWINVKGGWHEKENEKTETFSISSALVSPKSSNSLLTALTTCSDPSDYKLPYYEEQEMEIESGIFQLKGWINECSNSKSLDEFDPYADEINYPLFSLGSKIIERLGLNVDPDGKNWQMIHSMENVLNCETWSSLRENRDEEPSQSGMRLKAKLPFLKYLCSTICCDLIFEVSIKRELYYRYERDKREYSKPQHKIFILSGDGKLRTTNTSYQLG